MRSWGVVLLRVVALSSLAAAILVASPNRAEIGASGDQACDVPTQHVNLYARHIGEGPDGRPRLGYGPTPETASIPGPTLEMVEGECMAVTLHNEVPADVLAAIRDDPLIGSQDPNMPLGVSLHAHGVKYTTDSDGTLHTDSIVEPGKSRTYYWFAHPRLTTAQRVTSQGTAGYWWYHDHIVGTDHGTGGLYTGLFGGLVVRRPGDLKPDRPTYVVGFGPNQTINLKRYPDTPRYVATEGERVEFLVIGFGDESHTFHLHGHNWADNRTGILTGPLDDTRLVDNRTVGPADTFGFQVIAGEGVGAGEWMLHCHVQFHSDLGMVTFLEVLPDPLLPQRQGQPAPREHVHFGRGS